MNKYSAFRPAVSSTLSTKIRTTVFFLCTAGLSSVAHAYSTIDQTGNGHTATIEKYQVIQSGTYITQSGESNSASINQATLYNDSVGEIHQIGESNDTFIEQVNLYAGAHAGASSTGTGNLIQILQMDQMSEANANANATQTGDGNQATIIQESNESGSLTANIYQEGQDNAAWIYQIEVGTASADIEQIGEHNQATVYQTVTMDSFGFDGLVSAYIAGSENDLTIRQSDVEGSSIIYIQSGNGSVAEIDQTGDTQLISLINEDTHYNSDTIYQTAVSGSILISRLGGGENETSIYQASHGSEIIVEQVASENVTANVAQHDDISTLEAAILQTGSGYSMASIEQRGVDNQASIVQEDVMNSEASIQQPGYNHSAQISQVMGADNYAAILQSGDGSSAVIYQAGNGNYAMISEM